MKTITKNKAQLFGSLLVLIGAICFAAKSIFVKISYQYNIDAITSLTLRMLFSFPFFLFFLLKTHFPKDKTPLSIKEYLNIVMLGLAGYYLASYFDFKGLEYISAGLERLTLFIYPTLVVLLSFIFLKHKISFPEIISLVLTYLGILIAYYGEKMNNKSIDPIGFVYVFLAAFTYAIYLIGSSKQISKIGSIRYTSIVMTIASLAIFLHYTITGDYEIFNKPKEVYFYGLALGIISTVIPTFMISEGIRIIGSKKTSIIGSVGPISTILMGYIFLDEVIGWSEIIGTVLVLSGVLYISLHEKIKE